MAERFTGFFAAFLTAFFTAFFLVAIIEIFSFGN